MANTKRQLELAREAMVRQMAETEAQLQKYSKFPEDQFEPGTVIRFVRSLPQPVSPTMDIRDVVGEQLARYTQSRNVQARQRVMPRDEALQINEEILRTVERSRRAGNGVAPVNITINANITKGGDQSAETEDVDYTYVALKVHDVWFITGPRQAGKPMTWDDLVEFFISGKTKTLEIMKLDRSVDVSPA